jgi:predicted GNAT superfamily acetyltransferase
VAAATGRPGDFAFRPLKKPEEYRHAEELEAEALGGEAALAVPAPLLKSFQENGGLVLGAFADIYLAGVTASSLGWDGTTLYQQGHVTAVRPEYQNHRVGYRLKLFQREEVLRLGLAEVRWAFDPLHRPSASLAVRRLGARPDRYLTNFYGNLAESDGPRDESDRLHVRWTLGSVEVERRLAGEAPDGGADLRRRADSSVVLETDVGESGLRLPTAVAEPSGPRATLEIPFDLASIRAHEPASVRRWRHAVRDGFRAAFDLGYEVDDFAVVPVEHERRCFYFLRPAAPQPSPGPPATP